MKCVEVFVACLALLQVLVGTSEVSVVPNQFIVKFNGFYRAEARSRFIGAASCNASLVRVLPRVNPATDRYPSDFDLVELTPFDHSCHLVTSLLNHRLIKSVSPQHLFTGKFNFYSPGFWGCQEMQHELFLLQELEVYFRQMRISAQTAALLNTAWRTS